MIFKIYINVCTLLIFLSGIPAFISAQSADVPTKKSGGATYHNVSVAPVHVTSGEQDGSLPGTEQAEEGQSENSSGQQQSGSMPTAAQAGSCSNSFTNQTVSSTVSVLGCSILTVQNVTVTNSGNLSLSAPVEVIISGPFDVLSGGILDVTGGGEPQPVITDFTFYYDASGNRTSRVLGAAKHPYPIAAQEKSD
jgi:hypothetical protein